MLTVESQGKGTSCIDGASLLLASIQYILDKGSERGIVPKVLPPPPMQMMQSLHR